MSNHDHKHDPAAAPHRRTFFDWGDVDDHESEGATRWWERAGGKDARGGAVAPKSAWTPRTGSLSSFWSERFGGFRSSSRDSILDLVRVMNGLSRVGRIIYQNEIRFVLSGAKTAERTKAGVSTVRVDTTALNSKEVEWEIGDRVDATMGNALAEAAVQKHARPPKNSLIINTAIRELARKYHGTLNFEYIESIGHALANAANWIYSTSKVVEEFPGYAGYFESDRSFHHNEIRQLAHNADIANALTVSDRSLFAASIGAVWNTVTPDRALDVGPIAAELEPITRTLREQALAAKSSASVDKAVASALTELLSRFDPPPPEKQEQAAQALSDVVAELSLGDASAAKESPEEGEAVEAESASLRDYQKEDLEGNPHVKAACNYTGIPIDIYSLWQEPNARQHAVVKSRVFSLVQRVRASLSFRNEIARMDEQGLRAGLIDEGGLSKLALGDARIFRRQEVVSAPSVHIALMLDESGSMSGVGDVVARECAVLLHEATRNLPGVAISIWGHTANDEYSPGGATIYRYLERGHGDPDTLGSIYGRNNNLDGAAVAYAGKRMIELARPGESRILFVLCDGQPAGHVCEPKNKDTSGVAAGMAAAAVAAIGHRRLEWNRTQHYGYGGGMDHTRRSVDAVRKSGTQVFALGMGDGINGSQLTAIYGDSNWILCQKSQELPRALARLLKQALKHGTVV